MGRVPIPAFCKVVSPDNVWSGIQHSRPSPKLCYHASLYFLKLIFLLAYGANFVNMIRNKKCEQDKLNKPVYPSPRPEQFKGPMKIHFTITLKLEQLNKPKQFWTFFHHQGKGRTWCLISLSSSSLTDIISIPFFWTWRRPNKTLTS